MNLKEVFQRYAAVVFFDTETSGLDARTDQIIELAVLRVNRPINGSYTANHCDMFVKLPEGQRLPEEIVKLTGITDAMLEAEGGSEEQAAKTFNWMIDDSRGPVLMVAHNAQFDLLFVQEMLRRHPGKGEELLELADFLDSLTVYKDRRPYPHKLKNAIAAYKLQDKVQNTHRAIDDVAALYEVVKAMDNERPDLLTYVNIFGYNPKYGVSGYRIDGVTYWPQQFNNYMQAPNYTLPARVKRARLGG